MNVVWLCGNQRIRLNFSMTETFLWLKLFSCLLFKVFSFFWAVFYFSYFYMPTVYEQQSKHYLSWFRFVFLKGRRVVVSEIRKVIINIKKKNSSLKYMYVWRTVVTLHFLTISVSRLTWALEVNWIGCRWKHVCLCNWSCKPRLVLCCTISK